MEKIVLTPINLEFQKPTDDPQDCYFILADDYLRYRMDFFANEPIISNDPASGMDIVHTDFDIAVLRGKVSGVEKHITKNKKWRVTIFVDGLPNDLDVYFKHQSGATEFHDKVFRWLFGSNS